MEWRKVLPGRSHKFTPNVKTGSQKAKIPTTSNVPPEPLTHEETQSTSSSVLETPIEPRDPLPLEDVSRPISPSRTVGASGPVHRPIPPPRIIHATTNSTTHTTITIPSQPTRELTPTIMTPYNPDIPGRGPATLLDNQPFHSTAVPAMQFVHPTAAVQSKKRVYPFTSTSVSASHKKVRALSAVRPPPSPAMPCGVRYCPCVVHVSTGHRQTDGQIDRLTDEL